MQYDRWLGVHFHRWLLLLASAGAGACSHELGPLFDGYASDGDAKEPDAGPSETAPDAIAVPFADAGTEQPATDDAATADAFAVNDATNDAALSDSDRSDATPPPPPVCTPSSPPTEICNGKDDDCNGIVDDGCPRGPVWATGTSRPNIGDSTGGGEFSDSCAVDEVLVGLRVAAAGFISQVRGVCRKYVVRPTPSGDLTGASLVAGATRDLPPHPTDTTDPLRDLVCPEPKVLVGIKVSQQAYTSGMIKGFITPSISAVCADPVYKAGASMGVDWQTTTDIGPVSGTFASAMDWVETDQVAHPTVLVGLHGFSGAWLDRVGTVSSTYGVTFCTTAGSGGAPFNRANWMATASSTSKASADTVTNAYDTSPSTRWASGKPQSGDEWFKLDLGAVGCIGRVSITAPAGDSPAAYALSVSTDDQKYVVVANGTGQSSLPIDFASRDVRYIRINQTGMSYSWWSIADIAVQR